MHWPRFRGQRSRPVDRDLITDGAGPPLDERDRLEAERRTFALRGFHQPLTGAEADRLASVCAQLDDLDEAEYGAPCSAPELVAYERALMDLAAEVRRARAEFGV